MREIRTEVSLFSFSSTAAHSSEIFYVTCLPPEREMLFGPKIYTIIFLIFFLFSHHPSVLGRLSFLIAVHHVYLGFCSLFFILHILLFELLFTYFPMALNCNNIILCLLLWWLHC